MAKKAKLTDPAEMTVEAGIPLEPKQPPVARPRLRKLWVSNFRCIGTTPIEIELDDIVVLVGPNNVGKSAILRAYEVAMQEGSSAGNLLLADFPGETINAQQLPTIEIETVVFDENAPGAKWVVKDVSTGELVVREQWRWKGPGKPDRVGWDVAAGSWHATERPWGAPNIAQAYRPEAHRVEAFASPEDQAGQVIALLRTAILDRAKLATAPKKEGEQGADKSAYQLLLEGIGELQRTILEDAQAEIKAVQKALTEMIGEVFPGYSVQFDARPEDDLDKAVNLFKAEGHLRMGPQDGHQPPIERQGSGARRTLLWTALRILAEQRKRDTKQQARPHLLLLDEPEICLHPNAIRHACRVLYDLPKTGNWQVMVTTHSPAFVDLSRDNTSIVRVGRDANGDVSGKTVFRPRKAKLDDNDRANLKLLNAFDPYVAEFFFGGSTIVVEGDTEYTGFGHIIAKKPDKYKNIHIVRARGKATIVGLCKILNQFGTSYSVLHDSDTPTITTKKGVRRANPAWSLNASILETAKAGPAPGSVKVVASIPNFEEAFFGEEVTEEKPYTALMTLREDGPAAVAVEALLDGLVDHAQGLPANALAWTNLDELAAKVNAKPNR